ncbi:hypothetical protein [Dictyobacter kobayashii]|uniref:Uncharacterized protein n=1 Tax=Dictyobacter kobayashii TaxID=2014872 RepID=A0A402AQQ0_9CHLR|nr:hypothetical protein [Dictyobacter kobayashii]GCE21420.1 hypothetical protein KDK_52200 [Dictyobacter kobayashii]
MQTSLPQPEQRKQASSPSWLNSQSLQVARFTLYSYSRSGWILLDIVLVWLIHQLFFSSPQLTSAQFFGVAIPALSAEAIFSTLILTRRAMKANLYLPLARLTTRSTYLNGIILATCALRIACYLLLLLFTTALPANWSYLLSSSPSVLLISILCALLTIAFSNPLATTTARIIFLLWIVLVLWSNFTQTSGFVQYLKIFQLPLQPVAASYQIVLSGTIGAWGWVGLGIIILYIAITIAVATYWFSKRDLHLT